MAMNRRDFIQRSVVTPGVVSLAGAAPAFFTQAGALAAENNANESILVVVQLSGGNDGLNTVVPYADSTYRKSRPKLGVPKSDVLTINKQMGWHPAARGAADLLEQGKMAVVQGIGYENPNRSHFESMDIWHTCDRKDARRPEGWLGRYLDQATPEQRDSPAMHLGEKKLPLALAAANVRAASVKSIDQFRLRTGNDTKLKSNVEKMASAKRTQSGGLLGFVQTSTEAALSASERVEKAKKGYKTNVDYPKTRLAGRLKTIAQLIDAQLPTRVYYVEVDGFDTHSRQAPAHRALLSEFFGGLAAFVNDLIQHGHGERVLTMCFSEFGRRVQENASEGTDHGAAGPLFLAGPVKPGVHGPNPNLDKLFQGDLKYSIDFRRVYSTVLENWFGAESKEILGGDYQTMPLLSKRA